jgi:hypothetical protein
MVQLVSGRCYKTFYFVTEKMPNKLECLSSVSIFIKPCVLRQKCKTSGLYYKHVTIINYASSGINKFRASLNDDARVVIYNHHMFIVQATEVNLIFLLSIVSQTFS